MAKTISRAEARAVRRRTFHLGRTAAKGSSELSQASAAFDYLRSLLNDQPDDVRREVGGRVVAGLLAVAASLEPTTTTRGTRQ